MQSLFRFFLTLVLSSIVGYSLYISTNQHLIKPIDGFNQINFNITYLNNSNKIKFDFFNERLVKSNTYEKQIKKGILLNNTNPIESLLYNEDILVESVSILAPLLSSHKIELSLYGKNNYILLGTASINSKNIPIEQLKSKLKSTNKFKIGTINSYPDYIIIELNDDTVTFDITSIFNPLTLTESTKEILDKDFEFLNRSYLIACISIIFIILFITYKILEKRKKNYTPKIITIYFYFLFLLSFVLSLNNSFYLHFINLINYYPGDFLTNLVIFEQNYIPVLLIIISPFILAINLKQTFIKILLSIAAFIATIILIADNSLLIALGIRLNFNFATNYIGDIQYIFDFFKKIINSSSGKLNIISILSLIVIFKIFISNSIKIPKYITISFFVFLSITSSLGILPTYIHNGIYNKVLNAYQINGISLFAQGNANTPFTKDYQPRKNLNFKWETKTGLNKQKNVIILIVESWSCNLTFICGKGPSYMPKIEQLANNNTFFANYHGYIESTSTSVLSIVKSVPSLFLDSLDTKEKLYKENDLITAFNSNNYKTAFISSTDHVYGMDKVIKSTHFNTEILPTEENFPNIKDRYIFNSVDDYQLFNYILSMIKNEQGKFLYVTKTASNHAPYNSPVAHENMELAFKYTDEQVYNFIEQLKAINYFDNGILVLLGDHKAWTSTKDYTSFHSAINDNHTPLIIIEKNSNNKVFYNQLGHSSLGVILQYLMLPNYRMNKFNTNPYKDEKDEILFGVDYTLPAVVNVRYNQKEGTIVLNGDKTYIKENDVFSEQEELDILGYLAWIK